MDDGQREWTVVTDLVPFGLVLVEDGLPVRTMRTRDVGHRLYTSNSERTVSVSVQDEPVGRASEERD